MRVGGGSRAMRATIVASLLAAGATGCASFCDEYDHERWVSEACWYPQCYDVTIFDAVEAVAHGIEAERASR